MNPLNALWQIKAVRIVAGILTIGVSWFISVKVAKHKGRQEGKDEAEKEVLEDIIEKVEAKEVIHEEVNNYSDDEHIDSLLE